MPRIIRNIATGTVVRGGVDVLLGKNDPDRSWTKYGSPLRWSFFGGKVKQGESTLDAFVRELPEEIGLKPVRNMTEQVAVILIHKWLPNGTYRHLRMHVFLARDWTGLPRETKGKEIREWRWCNQRALPYCGMLAADPLWMPLIFGGKKLIVRVVTDWKQGILYPPIPVRGRRWPKSKVLIREVESFSECFPQVESPELEFDECPPLV